MRQRTFSSLGGILGIISFFLLIVSASAANPSRTWRYGDSPLIPAVWIAGLAIVLLALSRTPLRRILPIKTLGMGAFAVAVGCVIGAAILFFRSEGDMAWRMAVLGASGWFAQMILGIPYRAEQSSAISHIAAGLGISRREVIESLCAQLAAAGGDPSRLAMSVANDPHQASLEHKAIDEAVNGHCREHQEVWKAAKGLIAQDPET